MNLHPIAGDTVTLRGRGRGDYFLRLHTPFSIVGLVRYPYSVIVNHKTGKILIRISLSSQSHDYVTVHGHVFVVETEMILHPDSHQSATTETECS